MQFIIIKFLYPIDKKSLFLYNKHIKVYVFIMFTTLLKNGKEQINMKKYLQSFELKNYIKKLRTNDGFTLNEMVVAICIIIILVSLLIPKVTQYIRQAQYVHDVYAAKTIYDTLELAMLDPDVYSETQKSLSKSTYNMNNGSYITIPSKYTNLLRTRLKDDNTTEFYNPYKGGVQNVGGKLVVKAQGGMEGITTLSNAANELIGYSRNLGCMMDIRFYDWKATSAYKGWKHTDQFVIVASPADPRDLAVYLGSSQGKNENGVIMKLYPVDDSRTLDFSFVQIVK